MRTRPAGKFKLSFVIGRLFRKSIFDSQKTQKVSYNRSSRSNSRFRVCAARFGWITKVPDGIFEVDKRPQYYVWRKAHFFMCRVLLGVPPAASFEPLRLACNECTVRHLDLLAHLSDSNFALGLNDVCGAQIYVPVAAAPHRVPRRTAS